MLIHRGCGVCEMKASIIVAQTIFVTPESSVSRYLVAIPVISSINSTISKHY